MAVSPSTKRDRVDKISPARITLFGAEKGGVGKSSLAVNLAALLAGQGRNVLLVDTDPQGSVLQWTNTRKADGHTPTIECVVIYGKSLPGDVRALASKYDDIIIDAGGRDSIEMRSAMLVANILVTPCHPSQFDIYSSIKMNRLVGEARAFNETLHAYIVINEAPTNALQSDEDDLREYLTEMTNYAILNTSVKSRKAYRLSGRDGLAVTEFLKQTDKAVAEMQALAVEIWK